MTPPSKALTTGWCTPLDNKNLTVKDIALFGMLGGLTFGAKFVMSWLPGKNETLMIS